ncbi:MAG: hypothetical protein AB7E52_02155 [Bdellovibrionales bacterium]
MLFDDQKYCSAAGLWGVRALILLALLGMSSPASAQLLDPFAAGAGGTWVPLADYEKAHPAAEPVTDAVQTPVLADSREQGEQASKKTGAVPNVGTGRALATPERPLQIPVMPAMAVAAPPTVTSTENSDLFSERDKAWHPVAQEPLPQDKKIVQLQQTPWLQAAKADAGLVAPKEFQVRLSLLPSPSIRSIPAQRVTQSKMAREMAALKAQNAKEKGAGASNPAEVKQAKANVEACKAYNEFRLRQLQAIQTDRQTLAKIKAVLADLGLAKKLSFMTDAEVLLGADALTK